MKDFKTQLNGNPIVYTQDGIQYGKMSLPFSEMSDIVLIEGDSPSWQFTYKGRMLQIPYSASERDKIEPFIHKAKGDTVDELAVFAVPEAAASVSTATKASTKNSVKTPAEAPAENKEKEAFWSVGRLVVGIFAIIFFILVTFQSCAAGVSNALEESDSFSGSSGLFLAVFMLVGGIVGIATRKSMKKGGPIASGILFILGALMGATSWNSDFGDLQIWTVISLIFGAFYIFCAIKTKGTKHNNRAKA